MRDLYLAHLALSDLDGGKSLHAERTTRAGPGIVGIREADRRIWNGNWQVAWHEREQVNDNVLCFTKGTKSGFDNVIANGVAD